MSLSSDSLIRRSDDVIYAAIGEERGMLLNLEADRYHAVNLVATRLWKMLETPKTLGALCAHIGEEFDVDPSTCRAEVGAFIGQLVERGVVIADQP